MVTFSAILEGAEQHLAVIERSLVHCDNVANAKTSITALADILHRLDSAIADSGKHFPVDALTAMQLREIEAAFGEDPFGTKRQVAPSYLSMTKSDFDRYRKMAEAIDDGNIIVSM